MQSVFSWQTYCRHAAAHATQIKATAFIQEWHLFEGGVYYHDCSMHCGVATIYGVAFNQVNTVADYCYVRI